MLRIVIVDDSKEDLLLTQRVVQQCGFINPIVPFNSGDEFVSHVKDSQDDNGATEPTLLLLDLIMSPKNGLEVLRFWQASRFAKRSFVVMVSGLNDLKVINKGYQLGARTFLLKPITKNELLHAVGSFDNHLSIRTKGDERVLHWVDRANEHTTRILSSATLQPRSYPS